MHISYTGLESLGCINSVLTTLNWQLRTEYTGSLRYVILINNIDVIRSNLKPGTNTMQQLPLYRCMIKLLLVLRYSTRYGDKFVRTFHLYIYLW